MYRSHVMHNNEQLGWWHMEVDLAQVTLVIGRPKELRSPLCIGVHRPCIDPPVRNYHNLEEIEEVTSHEEEWGEAGEVAMDDPHHDDFEDMEVEAVETEYGY